jgi:hypothetical protein
VSVLAEHHVKRSVVEGKPLGVALAEVNIDAGKLGVLACAFK